MTSAILHSFGPSYFHGPAVDAFSPPVTSLRKLRYTRKRPCVHGLELMVFVHMGKAVHGRFKITLPRGLNSLVPIGPRSILSSSDLAII